MRFRTPPAAPGSSGPKGCRPACRPTSTANASSAGPVADADLLSWLATDPFEHPQRTEGRNLPELTGIDCAAIDVVRRTPAVLGVREHIVDDQRAAGAHPLRPTLEVLVGCGLGVAAVDEQEPQWCLPAPGHDR